MIVAGIAVLSAVGIGVKFCFLNKWFALQFFTWIYHFSNNSWYLLIKLYMFFNWFYVNNENEFDKA